MLFNTRNSIELVGKVGLVQSPPLNTVFNTRSDAHPFSRRNPREICLLSNVLLDDFRDRMAYAKRATTNVAAVYAKNLFPLPVAVAPHAEQRRIVAKIEELFSDLDAGVAALERVRANLKRYRAAVLNAAVEGKLTEDWRRSTPTPNPPPSSSNASSPTAAASGRKTNSPSSPRRANSRRKGGRRTTPHPKVPPLLRQLVSLPHGLGHRWIRFVPYFLIAHIGLPGIRQPVIRLFVRGMWWTGSSISIGLRRSRFLSINFRPPSEYPDPAT